MIEAKKDPIVTLEAQAKDFDFSKLRAAEDNKLANSGETMYLDLQRMNFVINGEKIDKNLIIALKEGTKDYKSELFSKDDVSNSKSGKEREIDTNHGRVFVDSILKGLEKGLAQDALHDLWGNHCRNPETADHQKNDVYKKGFERFYNAGQRYKHLLQKREDKSKNYRQFAKEVFKEMFKYAGAEIPSDPILEELVTNCNQAGYGASVFSEFYPALSSCGLTLYSPKKALNIYCIDRNHIKVKSDMVMPITTFNNPEEKICDLSSSLEFTIESQDGRNSVTYKSGKLSLVVSQELENYHTTNQEKQLQSEDTMKKSLLDVIIESFLVLVEKFSGTKLKNKHGIRNEIKNALSCSNRSEAIVIKDIGCSPIRIECSLERPLNVSSRLESVKPPIHGNQHVHDSRKDYNSNPSNPHFLA